MKRPYELTFIIRVDTPEDLVDPTITQVKTWVEANDQGAVKKIDRWGRRRLAYQINNQREGFYVLFDAEIDTTSLPELERNLKLSPNVLRYLLVRPD